MKKAIAIVLVLGFTGCAGLLTQRQTKYLAAHPETTEDNKRAIMNGKLRIGMTKAEVIASLGDTDNKTQSATFFGTSESWTYGGCTTYSCAMTFLNFSGDKLVSVNTSKS